MKKSQTVLFKSSLKQTHSLLLLMVPSNLLIRLQTTGEIWKNFSVPISMEKPIIPRFFMLKKFIKLLPELDVQLL